MRIHQLLIITALATAVAAPVSAQSVKKIGSNVHRTLKKAGNDVKEIGGEVGSVTHRNLKKAGKDSKAELKRTTGAKPIGGDVGKAAHRVSHSGKKVGRNAKKELKAGSSKTHNELTKTGKEAKAVVKP